MSQRRGPVVYLSDLPRNTPRPLWKRLYRDARVRRREFEKAALDMLIYGSGFVHYPNEGDPEHVPLDKVMIE